MGLADIVVESLESTQIRQKIGNAGTRIFKASAETKQTNNDGGILGWLWNGATRFIGLIGSEAFKLIGFTLTGLWGLFVSTAQFIYNFNWNITDKEIDNQIAQSWSALSGMFGGALGNLVGYLGCGVLPGAVMFAFNEPLGVHVLKNVSEELAEEFLANVANVTRYAFQSGVQSLLLWAFKNTRKLIKDNTGFVQKMFGAGAADVVKAWGKEGSKPWSFAKAVNDKVESIPNEAVRNFVEEFLEEAWEGCVEAGYVVANSVDSFIAAEKLRKAQALDRPFQNALQLLVLPITQISVLSVVACFQYLNTNFYLRRTTVLDYFYWEINYLSNTINCSPDSLKSRLLIEMGKLKNQIKEGS